MSKDYSLSMSGSSLRMPECMITISTYLETRDWAETRKRIVEDNLYDLNAVSTRKRVASELIKRLSTLTDSEIGFLSESYGDDKCAMLWVSVCRTYQFVRDYSEMMLVDRYSKTIPDVTQEAFDVFYDEQSQIHPELLKVTQKGREKIRNVVKRLAVECNLLDESGNITPLHPTPLFVAALDPDHSEDMQLFPGRNA